MGGCVLTAKRGLVVAAPASGAGKTLVTLGLLHAMKRRGLAVTAAKSGPDYIDPRFHEATTGQPSVNLDAWAMTPASLRARAAGQPGDFLLVEGAMGVLDGAGVEGRGSVADLARTIGLPVLLVIDASKTAQSAVLSAIGLRTLCPDLALAGVLLNRVGSLRHEAALRHTFDRADIPVLGALPRKADLALPERHLGLVQAMELSGLDHVLDLLADLTETHADIDQIIAAARPLQTGGAPVRLPPIGQRIAIARDVAFAFTYPHIIADWRALGASVHFFSPLADEPPPNDCDAIFLAGGYPELHAARLAEASSFKAGIHKAAADGTLIYGECGGYMVLGDTIKDADGKAHGMLGLLPVSTSFARRKLHLGYRRLQPLSGAVWQGLLAGHEFHYATVESQDGASPLFKAEDAFGETLSDMGLRAGNVMGSFAHVIGPAPP